MKYMNDLIWFDLTTIVAMTIIVFSWLLLWFHDYCVAMIIIVLPWPLLCCHHHCVAMTIIVTMAIIIVTIIVAVVTSPLLWIIFFHFLIKTTVPISMKCTIYIVQLLRFISTWNDKILKSIPAIWNKFIYFLSTQLKIYFLPLKYLIFIIFTYLGNSSLNNQM